jgi:DNA-binding response OmpR family regulator
LIVLDLGLPDLEGGEVCRRVRTTSQVPIIVLSARGSDTDKISALDQGADDYVTKPFQPSVLAARMRAVLRRATRAAPAPTLRFGDLEIDPLGMEVRRGGAPLALTPTEYRLLLMLAENAGIVLGRERLLEEVWGYVWAGDTRLVDMHVRRLRGKIGHDAIETVRGAGYKMVRP